MDWPERNIVKTGIVIVFILLFLILIVWLLVPDVNAHERSSGIIATITVQSTPTEDATVTALSKEQLTLQVKQLQDQQQSNWLANNSTALIAAITAIVVAFIGFTQWSGTARQAKDKDLKAQTEERFKTAVAALGDEKEGTQVGGAILLRSFLNREDQDRYQRYYTQIFDLAVAYLRLRKISTEPKPPDSLNQALIRVFRESFPLARDLSKQSSHSLDALGVRLDYAYLVRSDLIRAHMPESSLRKAKFFKAMLRGIDLRDADLSEADLRGADLSEAKLRGADFTGADFTGANLSAANLLAADLSGADLKDAVLKDAKMFGVRGLSEEQLSACKARGAILDDPNGKSVTSSRQGLEA